MTVAGEDLHRAIVDDDLNAPPVMFDLVNPLVPLGGLADEGREHRGNERQQWRLLRATHEHDSERRDSIGPHRIGSGTKNWNLSFLPHRRTYPIRVKLPPATTAVRQQAWLADRPTTEVTMAGVNNELGAQDWTRRLSNSAHDVSYFAARHNLDQKTARDIINRFGPDREACDREAARHTK